MLIKKNCFSNNIFLEMVSVEAYYASGCNWVGTFTRQDKLWHVLSNDMALYFVRMR